MVLRMSISASILILVIVVIRAALLGRLPKKAFLALWGMALFRLLIPLNLPSKFSFFTMISTHLQEASVHDTALISNIVTSGYLTENVIRIKNSSPQTVISLFGTIWIIGVLIVVLFFIFTHLRCRQNYKMALLIDNPIIMSWQNKHPTKRRVLIKETDRITSPLTYGILHPIVLLPKSIDYTESCKLEYILAHEYTHIKRFDVFSKWMLVIAVSIHWFNPLAWIMYILANRDIEISCDEKVVRIFGESIKSSYALALINLEETRSNLNQLCSNFSKNAIEERIKSIMKIKKVTSVWIIFAVLLVGGTATVFATSAEKNSDRIKQSYVQMSVDDNKSSSSLEPSIANYDLVDEVMGEHDILVGETAIYTPVNADKLFLKQGDERTITFSMVDRKFDNGQGLQLGYILNGNRTQLFEGQIKSRTEIKLNAPTDGNYSFYVECASSDPLLVEYFSIN